MPDAEILKNLLAGSSTINPLAIFFREISRWITLGAETSVMETILT